MDSAWKDAKAAIKERLETAMADLPPGDLADAMRYACIGGKRLRGFLVLESARLHGVSEEAALPVAASVEALHAYSLVHDDLPAMDDDDLRRGMPCVHIQWSQATAILAGDALQTLAFGLLTAPEIGDAETRLTLIAGLARAVGAEGMVHGQALDIAAEVDAESLDLDQITRLQAAKTGALIRYAAEAGAILAGADPAGMSEYAKHLGLAFQIHDDILDVTGDEETTGKRVGKDEAAGKATFVSHLGLDGARARAEALSEAAISALSTYGPEADHLRQLARFVIDRHS